MSIPPLKRERRRWHIRLGGLWIVAGVSGTWDECKADLARLMPKAPR